MEPADPAAAPATPASPPSPATPQPASPPSPATPQPASPPSPDAPRPSPAARPVAPAGVRTERSARDMALSLVVLLVPIALLLGFYRLVLDGDEPITVDPRPAVAEARAAAAFPVAEPTGLSADWRVTTATFRRLDGGATLRIGYVDPDSDPVQLVQSSIPFQKLVTAELGAEAGPRGPVRVGARTWQRYAARPGETALVLLEKGRTIIAVGATDESRLQTLATSLP